MSLENEDRVQEDPVQQPEFPLTGDEDDVANPITERRAAYLQSLASREDKYRWHLDEFWRPSRVCALPKLLNDSGQLINSALQLSPYVSPRQEKATALSFRQIERTVFFLHQFFERLPHDQHRAEFDEIMYYYFLGFDEDGHHHGCIDRYLDRVKVPDKVAEKANIKKWYDKYINLLFTRLQTSVNNRMVTFDEQVVKKCLRDITVLFFREYQDEQDPIVLMQLTEWAKPPKMLYGLFHYWFMSLLQSMRPFRRYETFYKIEGLTGPNSKTVIGLGMSTNNPHVKNNIRDCLEHAVRLMLHTETTITMLRSAFPVKMYELIAYMAFDYNLMDTMLLIIQTGRFQSKRANYNLAGETPEQREERHKYNQEKSQLEQHRDRQRAEQLRARYQYLASQLLGTVAGTGQWNRRLNMKCVMSTYCVMIDKQLRYFKVNSEQLNIAAKMQVGSATECDADDLSLYIAIATSLNCQSRETKNVIQAYMGAQFMQDSWTQENVRLHIAKCLRDEVWMQGMKRHRNIMLWPADFSNSYLTYAANAFQSGSWIRQGSGVGQNTTLMTSHLKLDSKIEYLAFVARCFGINIRVLGMCKANVEPQSIPNTSNAELQSIQNPTQQEEQGSAEVAASNDAAASAEVAASNDAAASAEVAASNDAAVTTEANGARTFVTACGVCNEENSEETAWLRKNQTTGAVIDFGGFNLPKYTMYLRMETPSLKSVFTLLQPCTKAEHEQEKSTKTDTIKEQLKQQRMQEQKAEMSHKEQRCFVELESWFTTNCEMDNYNQLNYWGRARQGIPYLLRPMQMLAKIVQNIVDMTSSERLIFVYTTMVATFEIPLGYLQANQQELLQNAFVSDTSVTKSIDIICRKVIEHQRERRATKLPFTIVTILFGHVVAIIICFVTVYAAPEVVRAVLLNILFMADGELPYLQVENFAFQKDATLRIIERFWENLLRMDYFDRSQFDTAIGDKQSPAQFVEKLFTSTKEKIDAQAPQAPQESTPATADSAAESSAASKASKQMRKGWLESISEEEETEAETETEKEEGTGADGTGAEEEETEETNVSTAKNDDAAHAGDSSAGKSAGHAGKSAARKHGSAAKRPRQHDYRSRRQTRGVRAHDNQIRAFAPSRRLPSLMRMPIAWYKRDDGQTGSVDASRVTSSTLFQTLLNSMMHHLCNNQQRQAITLLFEWLFSKTTDDANETEDVGSAWVETLCYQWQQSQIFARFAGCHSTVRDFYCLMYIVIDTSSSVCEQLKVRNSVTLYKFLWKVMANYMNMNAEDTFNRGGLHFIATVLNKVLHINYNLFMTHKTIHYRPVAHLVQSLLHNQAFKFFKLLYPQYVTPNVSSLSVFLNHVFQSENLQQHELTGYEYYINQEEETVFETLVGSNSLFDAVSQILYSHENKKDKTSAEPYFFAEKCAFELRDAVAWFALEYYKADEAFKDCNVLAYVNEIMKAETEHEDDSLAVQALAEYTQRVIDVYIATTNTVALRLVARHKPSAGVSFYPIRLIRSQQKIGGKLIFKYDVLQDLSDFRINIDWRNKPIIHGISWLLTFNERMILRLFRRHFIDRIHAKETLTNRDWEMMRELPTQLKQILCATINESNLIRQRQALIKRATDLFNKNEVSVQRQFSQLALNALLHMNSTSNESTTVDAVREAYLREALMFPDTGFEMHARYCSLFNYPVPHVVPYRHKEEALSLEELADELGNLISAAVTKQDIYSAFTTMFITIRNGHVVHRNTKLRNLAHLIRDPTDERSICWKDVTNIADSCWNSTVADFIDVYNLLKSKIECKKVQNSRLATQQVSPATDAAYTTFQTGFAYRMLDHVRFVFMDQYTNNAAYFIPAPVPADGHCFFYSIFLQELSDADRVQFLQKSEDAQSAQALEAVLELRANVAGWMRKNATVKVKTVVRDFNGEPLDIESQELFLETAEDEYTHNEELKFRKTHYYLDESYADNNMNVRKKKFKEEFEQMENAIKMQMYQKFVEEIGDPATAKWANSEVIFAVAQMKNACIKVYGENNRVLDLITQYNYEQQGHNTKVFHILSNRQHSTHGDHFDALLVSGPLQTLPTPNYPRRGWERPKPAPEQEKKQGGQEEHKSGGQEQNQHGKAPVSQDEAGGENSDDDWDDAAGAQKAPNQAADVFWKHTPQLFEESVTTEHKSTRFAGVRWFTVKFFANERENKDIIRKSIFEHQSIRWNKKNRRDTMRYFIDSLLDVYAVDAQCEPASTTHENHPHGMFFWATIKKQDLLDFVDGAKHDVLTHPLPSIYVKQTEIEDDNADFLEFKQKFCVDAHAKSKMAQSIFRLRYISAFLRAVDILELQTSDKQPNQEKIKYLRDNGPDNFRVTAAHLQVDNLLLDTAANELLLPASCGSSVGVHDNPFYV